MAVRSMKRVGDPAILERKLLIIARRIVTLCGESRAALDIFFLRHEEMKALKARFFKKQTEPNVLAFPEPWNFPHPEMKTQRTARSISSLATRKYLGEIYLNRAIIRKTPERAVPLLIHGILHLFGYDHGKNADAERMEALERVILAKLNHSGVMPRAYARELSMKNRTVKGSWLLKARESGR